MSTNILHLNFDIFRLICLSLEIDDILQITGTTSKFHSYVNSVNFPWKLLWERDLSRFENHRSNNFKELSYRDAYKLYHGFSEYPNERFTTLMSDHLKADLAYSNGSYCSLQYYDCGRNHVGHVVGYAIRGNVELLEKALEEAKKTGLETFINQLREYEIWEYYGNFSAGSDGYIRLWSFSNQGTQDYRSLPWSMRNYLEDMKINPTSLKDFFYVGELARGYQLPNQEKGGEATLLHWATLGGQLEVVKLLCKYGAGKNFNVQFIPNSTPKDLARVNGLIEIYHYLNETSI